ncbi:MAG TPA: tetratricopeptide repeat protein [Oculatellaceae cyanobacterium]
MTTTRLKKQIDRGSSLARSAALGVLILCAQSVPITMVTMAVVPALAADGEWKVYCAKGDEAIANQNPVEAEGYYRKAVSLAQARGDAEPIETCETKLAEALALRNKPIEAQAIYKQLLASMTKRYGSGSKKLIAPLMALGSIQESVGDHTTAISFYQRALHLNEKSDGPYSPEFAESLHALGRANAKLGRRNEAVKQYKQAVSILMKEPSLQASEQLEKVMRDYTDLLKKTDDSDKSLINDFKTDVLNQTPPSTTASTPVTTQNRYTVPLQPSYKSSVAQPTTSERVTPAAPGSTEGVPAGAINTNASAWQNQTAFQLNTSKQEQSNMDPQIVLRGIEKPWSATTLSPAYKALNDSIVERNRYEQGEDYYKRMIATDINSLGAHHPSVANDMNGLAEFYIKRNDYAQAEPLLAKSFDIYQKTYGLNNILTISTCAALAQVEAEIGRADRATELYRLALSNAQSSLGANNFETAKILNQLAYLYFHQGKLEESRTMYGWALSSTEGAVGQSSPLLAACLKDYATVLRRLGQTDQASSLESRAATILDNSSHL